MSNYCEMFERVKDERRFFVFDELRVKGKAKKGPKFYVVMCAGLWAGMKPWPRHRCTTREQAEALLAKAQRGPGGGRDMWIEEKS